MASSLYRTVYSQACNANDALTTQMQQIQQIALNQQTQLSNLAYAQNWNTANQYATQLAQMNQVSD